jgi:hypothetical protein
MSGAISPLPQYAFIARCSVKKITGTTLPLLSPYGEGRGVYRVLVGERPLGRPRRRWEDNIKMVLREIGIDVAKWIWLAQDRIQCRAFVSTVMNLRVP